MPSKPKDWYPTHKEDIKRHNQTYYQSHKAEFAARNKKYREEHKEEIAASKRKWHFNYSRALKLEVFSHYCNNGEPQCVRCGIADIDVLCLDHVDGNGGGRIRRGGWMLYKQLRAQGYPEGYQVLCANCNLKKEILEEVNRACPTN